MDKNTKKFLVDIVNSVSPSGYEHGAQLAYKSKLERTADEIGCDSHGNMNAVLNKGGKPRVMLAGHCDELGFQIKYIDDEGFLYFSPLGGHDQGIVAGRRVTIHTSKGPVPGVIGKKPIHLQEEKERKTPSQIKKLWIDIGAKTKKRASEFVEIGDPVTYKETFQELDGGLAAGRGFDDKIGVFVVGNTIRRLKGKKFSAEVNAVSTVQEEVGLRGARTAAFGIDPQVGIAVDVTFASDYPSAEKKETGEVKMNGGPVISRGPNINHKVFEKLVAAAKKEKIPYQIEAQNRGTGTDANVIQLTRAGVPTGLVSVPNRYMHTPAELVSIDDAENTSKLLEAFIRSLTGRENWSMV